MSKERIKDLLGKGSRIVPASGWEKLEYIGAYLSGKGSGGGSIRVEVKAAFKFMNGSDLVIFDIGANKGDWTEEVLKVGKDRVRRVYQFEPSPYNIDLLKKRFSHDDRVRLVPSAASDKKGSAQLFANIPGSGIGSLYKRRLDHFNIDMKDSTHIETVTIDEIIETNKLLRLDFMKMDIEGHELRALHGAMQSLKNGTIRALSFEFGGANIDSRTYFQDFWYFLKPLGFEFFRILPSGLCVHVNAYREILENFRTTNYIAVKNE